jgi:MYXO-CTERM domain-containing protein
MRGVTVILLMSVVAGEAQADECANVLVVFDRSDSMNRVVPDDDRSRWEIAVPAVESIVARYAETVKFGLMLFPGDTIATCGVACTPGFVAVEIGADTAGAISEALGATTQCAGTPIGNTMELIPAMAALREEGKRNYVLLVTDGSETCDSDAAAVAGALSRQDPEVRTFVIGFGDQVDTEELDEVAAAGRTQAAFVAADEATLEAAFDHILGAVRDDPEFGCIGGELGDGGIPGLDAGVADAGADPDDAGALPAGADGDDGCGCRAAGAPRATDLGALAAMAAAALCLRRPRREPRT